MHNPILQDFPSQIDTPRLLLRTPRAGDGPLLHQAVMESISHLRQFSASLPWVIGEQSVEVSETFARKASADFLARRDFTYLLFAKDGKEFVGCSGLHRPNWQVPKLEIGYWCHAKQTGNCYISEAVQELAKQGFAQLGLARIEIWNDEENHAARKVAERCGFTLEGILRHETRAPDGQLRNTCLYARLVAE